MAVMADKKDLTAAKKLWEEFGNVPIDDNDCIIDAWRSFGVGTCRFRIWQWFEQEFDVSVAEDLLGQ